MKLESLEHNIFLLQVYATTSNAPDEDIVIFYDDVKKDLSKCKQNEIPIIVDNLNAKLRNFVHDKTTSNK